MEDDTPVIICTENDGYVIKCPTHEPLWKRIARVIP